MRILLDENVPVDILPVLHAAGIEAQSVNLIGWKRLQNGELIMRAREQCDLLLTRDKDFNEEYLKKHITPTFGVVLLAIPQQPGPAYAAVFARVWPTDFNLLVGKVSRLTGSL
jgi:predicted nuclease of predicted toxin-antitoxin system